MEQSEKSINKEIKVGELRLVFQSNLKTSSVKWYGRSIDMHPADTLIPVLTELFDDAGESICLVFNELDYLNSSTVVPLMDFIRGLDKRGIAIVLEYSKDTAWQRSMFEALKCLSKLLKDFKVLGT